jgi:hypothetical protein
VTTERRAIVAKAPLPLQPIFRDKHGALRFRENKMVSALLDWASSRGMSLNEMAVMDFSKEDRQQFAQLIGYSLSGYSELSYVTDKAWERAQQAGKAIKRRPAGGNER